MLNESIDSQSWIVIEDEELTAAALETAVENRVAQRRTALGQPPSLDLPMFGYTSPMPERITTSKTLYHHLRQLNEMEPPDTTSILAPSSATKVPILGRLWATIREQAHQLVLFYVNRALAYETVINNHKLSTLNELARLTESQQAEIRRLQEEVEYLKELSNHD
jgi:hypothetical protein